MYIFRNLRAGTGLMAAAALVFLLLTQLTGCSSYLSSPTAVAAAPPPELPATSQLQFDFSFFAAAHQLDKAAPGYENFLNAYLRTLVLEASARQVMAGPMAAFSAAASIDPIAHENGSWVWLYTWRQGADQTGIILRGRPAGDLVHWEMSILARRDPTGAVWISGTTSGDGSEGNWVFHDLETAGNSVSGEINWGPSYREFVSLESHNHGNTLRFNDSDPDFSITFSPGDGSSKSFIRWNKSGSGSLRVPDYNGGQEATWNAELLDREELAGQ
jgi:hypothetical protein